MQITSPQNPRFKQALQLRQRRGRESQDSLLIDGIRELSRAVAAHTEIREVFFSTDIDPNKEFTALIAQLERAGVPVNSLPERLFGRLSYGNRREGVVAVARIPCHALADLPATIGDLLAVLDQVEKPGNLGAVAQSADAAGVSALLVADGQTDLFNPNSIRASLGTIFSLPVAAATGQEVRGWLHQRRLQIVITRVDAERKYTQVDYRLPTAIVFGSEAHGLASAWDGPQVIPVHLPMLGVGDSLNVAAAAAVLFYEARRQRTTGPSIQSADAE